MSENYPDAPGFKDNHTSRLAALEIKPKAATIRDRVYKALLASNDGLTADEVAGIIGVDFMSVRPRLTELKEQGKITKTQRTRPTSRSGKKAAIYEIPNRQLELI